MKLVKIAIFASGSGTNAENIIRYLRTSGKISAEYILSNKGDAYVLERAKMLNVPTLVFNRQDFYEPGKILRFLKDNNIQWIILAGFLWLIPEYLITAYPNKIINIHPALLPKFGGKGMYGTRVHQAVIDNNEKESGITIHFVNNEYDKGKIIFQAKCKVEPSDTAESLASKVHELEYIHYPRVIEKLVTEPA
jgi:phosphoribosylglycinamide formyltransferase-1